MTAGSSLHGLTLLLSLTAGKQDRTASKHAAGITLHASDRPAADKGVSFTKPVPSNEGSKEPSQQLQQQPQSSRHAPAGTSKQVMAQRSTGRPPGMEAPTSEKYTPKSVHYLMLQGLWHKCNCAGEAAFKVYVAIGVVLKAAADSAEQLEYIVQRVGYLVISHLTSSHCHERHAFYVVCQRKKTSRPCCLMKSCTPSLHAQN